MAIDELQRHLVTGKSEETSKMEEVRLNTEDFEGMFLPERGVLTESNRLNETNLLDSPSRLKQGLITLPKFGTENYD